MACPPIPQPQEFAQSVFFCVQSPGFYNPVISSEQVKQEFSKAMCAQGGFGDFKRVPEGSVILGEDGPLTVTKESVFWQSETTFTDPDLLLHFAQGLIKTLHCDAAMIVFMPYYTPAPLHLRAATLKYVFGLLI